MNKRYLNLKENYLSAENIKKAILIVIPLVVVVIIVSSIVKFIGGAMGASSSSSQSSSQLDKPKATAKINKDFTFSLKNDTGKTTGSFLYSLQTADLEKQIIVKGIRATAIDGRIFLIVNLKLDNSQSQGLQVNTRDYIRLSVNNNTKELLAPEIHNDPVEVQAISVKYTRVGFAINESDKNFVLKVGEIDGDKKEIKLNFK